MLKKPWDVVPIDLVNEKIVSTVTDIRRENMSVEEAMKELREDLIDIVKDKIDFNFLVNHTHKIPPCFRNELIEMLNEYKNKVIASYEFQEFINKQVDTCSVKLSEKG